MTDHAELLRLDREARALAQTEFRRPLLVEAGAGTGKTSTLVARILAWALGPGWEARLADAIEDKDAGANSSESVAADVLDGITAITFTEAAAAEMAERVAASLAAIANGEEASLHGFLPDLLEETEPSERPLRALALLSVLDRLEARTIHAFCRTLLARYPLEGGLHPDLTVDADDRLLEEIVREVVEEAIKKAYAHALDTPLLELALRRIGPDRVAAALQQFTRDGLRATDLERDPFSAEELSAMTADLRGPIEEIWKAAGEGFAGSRSKMSESVVLGLESTVRLIETLPTESRERALELCSGLARIWSDKLLGRLKAWSKNTFNKTEVGVLGDATEAVAAACGRLEPKLRSWSRTDPELLRQARMALAPLAAEVRSRMRSRGAVTFNDLLREARDLLLRSPGTAARERRRIRQLLVDEFQDTDRTQCDLARVLGLAGDPDSRPGLFVVGDPKQSIYGWRDADLEAYSDFQQELLEAQGRRLVLYQNFRSAPVILKEVERSVAPVMHEVANLQPHFAPLVPAAAKAGETGFDRGSWAPVEYWISWRQDDPGTGKAGPRTLADDAARLEAKAIARDISRLHFEAGVEYGDVGLLLRATSKVEIYLAAMREAGVPFKVSRDKSYFRRREIIDAAALVRAVINPADHLALVTLLRSPMVGVPDVALLPLWCRDFPDLATRLTESEDPTLARARQVVKETAAVVSTEVPGIERLGHWPTSLEAALTSLAALRRSFRTDDPDLFVEKLRRVFLQEATEAARFLGAYRLANLERFFQDLESAMEDRGGDVESILRVLRRSVRDSEEADEASPGIATGTAVNVMTIHGAKGLQFEHVYLAQLHAEGGSSDRTKDKIDTRRVDGGSPSYRLFGAATPWFHLVEERDRRVGQAESVRTLYVALTRAKQRVVLVGKWPAAPAAKGWSAAKNHLELLQNRQSIPESIEDLARDISGAPGWRDSHQARWKMAEGVAADVSDTAGTTGRMVADRAEPRTEDLAGIEKQLASSAARRERARGRMSRVWSGTASAAAADRLDELFSEPGSGPPAQDSDRAAARDLGESFHRALEAWDLEADPAAELEHRRAQILARFESLEASNEGTVCEGTVASEDSMTRARKLMDRFAGGSLYRRFLEIAPRVSGREVPVLLPPSGDGREDPVGFTSGVIDLIYLDEETGEPVIVDFKTDQVVSEEDLTARARAYRPQEELYARAIQGLFDLERPPRTELWFIWSDSLHVNDPLWNNDGHYETSDHQE